MFLKRLEIQGFKSFAKSTVLEFQPGITAIVGPNGSGKSNIADAVRWVLGEQSKTLLRGKKAEDVIFVGSGTRSRASVAQVSVVFDNTDRKLPVDSAEVVFARRLHSDGTSEYLINQQPARLMDISDALVRAGFGQSRYTVMGQGTIDQFLLQGPAELKAVIEEGAGLAPYYDKRDKTLRRLETTRSNLREASALIAEIEPRLRTLRRQAKKLSERGEIEKKWRELFSGRLGHVVGNLNREKETLQAQINETSAEIEALDKKVAQYFSEIEKNDAHSSERAGKLSDIQQKINQEQKNKDRIQVALTEIRIKISSGSAGMADVAQTKSKLAAAQKEKAEINREVKELESNLKSAQEDIAEIVEILNSAKPDLVPRFNQICDKFLNTQRQFLQKLSDQQKDLEEVIRKSELEISSQKEGGIVEYQNEEQKLSTDLEMTQKLIADLQAKLENELNDISSGSSERREADKKIREIETRLNQFRSAQSNLKVELARVETKLEEEKKRAENALGADFKKIISAHKPISDPDVEAQITNLRRQIELIGGLDAETVQEYEETEERYGYLTGQVQDLEKAIIDLEEILKELDKQISERFDTAFDKVSKNFSEYFRVLFNGGRASLHILKEKRVIEQIENEDGESVEATEGKPEIVGIEVRATPPGKKLSSVAALSGGERSLTSCALIMAILDAYPSPFVVLDEADAALDESNSIRFAKILGHLSGRTQFITITHNRETMRRSHTLYGVTMGEDGVSQILSIKFEESGKFASE